MNTTLELTAETGAVVAPTVGVDQIDTDPVLKAVTTELQKYVSQTGLEPVAQQTLAEAFRPVFVKAHAAIAAANGVAESVKDATCVREIHKSRECRLAIRAVRIEGEKVHKSQKESALRFGKAVDGFKNILLAEIGPVEEALDAAEKTAERAEAARRGALKSLREAELASLLDGSPILYNLVDLTEEAWTKLLADCRFMKQAKIDAAAKAEADRIAKEAADRAERERIAAENAKLKEIAIEMERQAAIQRQQHEAEAAEQQRLAQIERKRIADERAAEKAKVDAESKRIEAERQEERRKADAEIQAAYKKAEAERQAAEVKARKEREAIQAKADEAARKAKEERDRLNAELAAKREAEENEQARIKYVADVKEKEAKRAAAAPDAAKLKAFALMIRKMELPSLSDATLFSKLTRQRAAFADFLEQLDTDLL